MSERINSIVDEMEGQEQKRKALNEASPRVIENILNSMDFEERDATHEALEQRVLDPSWYETYENIDDPEIRERLQNKWGKVFHDTGHVIASVVYGLSRANTKTYNLYKERDRLEEEGVEIPFLTNLMTLPSDYPEVRAEGYRSFGESVGSTIATVRSAVKARVMEARIESSVRSFLRSEGIIDD